MKSFKTESVIESINEKQNHVRIFSAAFVYQDNFTIGTVTASINGIEGHKTFTAAAKRNPIDPPNPYLGRKIAFHRAVVQAFKEAKGAAKASKKRATKAKEVLA